MAHLTRTLYTGPGLPYTGPALPLYGTLLTTPGYTLPCLRLLVSCQWQGAGELDMAMGLGIEPFTRQSLALEYNPYGY